MSGLLTLVILGWVVYVVLKKTKEAQQKNGANGIRLPVKKASHRVYKLQAAQGYNEREPRHGRLQKLICP